MISKYKIVRYLTYSKYHNRKAWNERKTRKYERETDRQIERT